MCRLFQTMNRLRKLAAIAGCILAFSFVAGAQTNFLTWHKDSGRVDADIHGEALWPLLQNLATQTGWHVFVEPGATHNISAKFNDVSSGDALKMLLGDLNFAFVPKFDTNSQLYVFRTTMKNATRRVAVQKPVKHVPNELILKVKPGTDMAALARLLNAKITGQLDKYGVYRLQFADASDTDAALSQLQNNSDVEAVGYNDYFDAPSTPQTAQSASGSSPSLTLSPPPASGKVVVGLIDTGVQSLGANMDQFVLPEVSVADGTSSDPGLTHGTAMLSILLSTMGSVTGGNVSAQVQPYDVYGSDSTATTWNVAQAFADAVNNGNNPINMSLGSPDDSSILGPLISEAASKGIVVFAASGNDPTGTPYFPAADSGAYAVTATGQPGQLAAYANVWSGDPTMMALPGTATVSFGGQTWVVTGTSTATAEATGADVGNTFAHGWTLQQTANTMINHFTVPK